VRSIERQCGTRHRARGAVRGLSLLRLRFFGVRAATRLIRAVQLNNLPRVLLSSRNINGLALLGLAAACRDPACEAVLRAHGALL